MIISLCLFSALDYFFTVWGVANTKFEELNPLAVSLLSQPPIYLQIYKALITFGYLGLAIAIYFKKPFHGRLLIWVMFAISAGLMFYWIIFFEEFYYYMGSS